MTEINFNPHDFKNIITLSEPDNPASEAYRALRTNIMFKNFDKPMQVINITSAQQYEGKSTILLNLAVVYAQLNKKVLIIDLDLRVPSIHKNLKLRNHLGITDLLNNRIPFSEVVNNFMPNIDVITSGTKILYQSEFIQSKILADFVNACRNQYDIILIDCPPVVPVTDALITAQFTDGTLLVCESNRNITRTLQTVETQFSSLGKPLLGVVINKVPRSHAKYYNYSYKYYGNEDKKEKKKRKSIKQYD